jgi:hypothetical protein
MKRWLILSFLPLGLAVISLKLFPVTQERSAPKTLRMATPYSVPLKSVDPASAPDLVTYQAMASLFSRLVYFKEANDLALMAAESLEWDGATLSIKVKRWKTIDGYEISAQDAAASLRRLFILDSNSHGFVKDLLCPNEKLTDPLQDCKGIAVDGDHLRLTVEDARKRTFLLPLLASADYSIIPIPSLDLKNPRLPIIDFRNTSGPYHCESKTPEILTKAGWNENHFWPRDGRPRAISFHVYGSAREAALAADHEKIDIVPKDFFIDAATVEWAKQSRNVRVTSTQPLEQLRIYISNSGIKKLTKEQRALALTEARQLLLQMNYPAIDCSLSETLFPPSTIGDLDPAQLDHLKTSRQNAVASLGTETPAGPQIKGVFWAFGDSRLPKKSDGRHVSLIERGEIKASPVPKDEFPVQVLPVDSAFYEDISLLAYEFSGGRLGMDATEGRQWIADYMSIEDQAERITKLKAFHFNALNEWMVLPVCMRPYYIIHRPYVQVSTPTLMASSAWWMYSITE